MIAVTGATGFLGRHMIRALSERNLPSVALVRKGTLPVGIRQEGYRLVDFRNVDELAKSLEGVHQVLHLAGRVNGPIEELQESNVSLMRRLVEAAKRARVTRIVFLSSVAAQTKKGPYGIAKWESEEILRSSGIPYVIFRAALIYGAGDTKNLALMEKMLKVLPVLPLLGGGRFMIQPVYVEDVVPVVVRALEGDRKNRIYHLAGPEQISLKEMIDLLAARLGKKPLLIPVPLKPVQVLTRFWSFLFPGTRLPVKQILELDQHGAFEIEEARSEMGFSPRTFQEGMCAMAAPEALCAG